MTVLVVDDEAAIRRVAHLLHAAAGETQARCGIEIGGD
jgi:CheY-like chemotaxis protein